MVDSAFGWSFAIIFVLLSHKVRSFSECRNMALRLHGKLNFSLLIVNKQSILLVINYKRCNVSDTTCVVDF